MTEPETPQPATQLVEITWTSKAQAVIWDGTAGAWDAILDLERGECWLDPERPGLVFVYGHGTPIPIGAAVYSDGLLQWRSVESCDAVG